MTIPDDAELASRIEGDPQISRVAGALADVPGCWLVGGAVRDLLLGATAVDLDVVVEGDALEAARAAAAKLGGTVREHERFGTATVTSGDLAFDLVTARRESYPRPGALPEVEASSLHDDLARRDFTVNAMAVGLSEQERALLQSVPGAVEDLEARRLTVLHPRSFLDDPTRMLRLVRYGARLGFETQADTGALAREAVEAGVLETVSGGRIGTELMLMLRESTGLDALERAAAVGLDRALHRDLRLQPELARRAVAALPEGADRGLVLLATTAGDFERDELRRWLDDMELTAAQRDAVIAAALDAEPLASRLAAARRPSEIAALVRGRPPEQLAVAAALGAGDQVDAWTSQLRHVALGISGDDLVAAGIPEGPAIGRGLAAALAAKLDGALQDREAELRAAVEAARGD